MKRLLIPLIILLLISCNGNAGSPDEQPGSVSIEISNITFGRSWFTGVTDTTRTFNPGDTAIYYSFDYESSAGRLEKVWLEWDRSNNLFLSTAGVPNGVFFPSDGSFSGVLKNNDGFPTGNYHLRVKFLRDDKTIETQISGDNGFFVFE